MIFLKDTMSYKLISLLDEMKIKEKYMNILLFIISFLKFKISKKILLKRKISNNDKIKLFIELFKERFYLEQLIKNTDIKTNSNIQYELNNNILLVEVDYYTNKIRINIEYTISQNKYCIFIYTINKNFNINENNLNIKSILEVFETIINILFDECIYLIDKIFKMYLNEVMN